MIDPLLIITALWLAAASFTDLKKSEVSDWLSFSLIAIALSIRTTESIILWDYSPILISLIGLAAFFILSNIMYYGKLFAGGDVKLMTALGPIVPSLAFLSNMLIAGGIYGIVFSAVLAMRNFKSFSSEMKKRRNLLMISLFVSMLLAILYFFISNPFIFLLSLSMIFISFIFAFVNSVEKACLIKMVSPEKLTVGDWLMKNVRVHGKVIKADFEGLTKKEIHLIKKSKMKVMIKYGIPFVPVFLIAFLITVLWGNIFLIFI
jgi:Flp pilus assembly protein protease CpaA